MPTLERWRISGPVPGSARCLACKTTSLRAGRFFFYPGLRFSSAAASEHLHYNALHATSNVARFDLDEYTVLRSGEQSRYGCTHDTLGTVSNNENRNIESFFLEDPDNGVSLNPTVGPVGAGQDHNPPGSNVGNTWNNYAPFYPMWRTDGAATIDPMLATTAFGHTDPLQSAPSTVLMNSGSFFDNTSSLTTSALGATSSGPPFANDLVLPAASAFTSYTPFPSPSARFPCVHPGCTKDFSRRSEMTRHCRQVHDLFGKQYSCFYNGCSRNGFNGFARKDKLRDHQKAAHGVIS